MENESVYTSLLERTKGIIEKHSEEIRKNQFNLFSILRKEHDEVNLHSRFIYEILNPQASHNQGNLFLNLLLGMIEEKIRNIFEEEVKLQGEEGKIFINREHSFEEGRFDLLCKLGENNALLIENKIYEEVGEGQLQKYLDHLQNEGYEKYYIVLLTLDDETGEEGIGNIPNLINITYKEDIKKWIGDCIKEVALTPMLRETLNMYRNLVLKLTGQSYSREMIEEMKNMLKENRTNLKAALEIANAIEDIKVELQKEFWRELDKKLENKLKEIKLKIASKKRWDDAKVENNCVRGRNRGGRFGLSIPLMENDYDKVTLAFEILIYDRVYYRFSMYKGQYGEESNLIRKENKDYKILRNEYGEVVKRIEPDFEDSGHTFYRTSSFGEFRFRELNAEQNEILDLVETTEKEKKVRRMVDEEIIKYLKDFQERIHETTAFKDYKKSWE